MDGVYLCCNEILGGAESNEGMVLCDSLEGGAEVCSVPRVIPGRRGEGLCSVNVTWNKLNTQDVVGFQGRYASVEHIQ